LTTLAQALLVVDQQRIRFNEAELHRLKGELLLRRAAEKGIWHTDPHEPMTPAEIEAASPALVEAEACFRRALDVARRQQARSLELRAAMSLSRLWQQQGESEAAREVVAEIYKWFTQGLDTADIQAAKVLLEG
jgi:hypothetical protein